MTNFLLTDGVGVAPSGRAVPTGGWLCLRVATAWEADPCVHLDDAGVSVVAGEGPAVAAASMLDRPAPELLRELPGHAVVRYDRRDQSVSVVRDAAGLQHLYMWAEGEQFALSTSLAWLLAHLAAAGLPPRLCPTGVALYLSLQYVPSPWTLFRSVRQVEPGEEVRLNRAGDLRRTRHPVEPWRTDTRRPACAAVTEGGRILDLVGRSVDRLVDPAEPTAVLVSGGMDTSLVCSLLDERREERPLALTATFGDHAYDEAPFARVVAQRFGLEHVEVPVTPDAFEALPAIVRRFETPHGDRAIFAEHLLCERARERGIAQLVTGEGGDELLGPPRSRDEDSDFSRLPDANHELAAWYLEATALARAPIRHRLLERLGVGGDPALENLERLYADVAAATPYERLYFGQWRTWLIDGVCAKDRMVAAGGGLRAVLPIVDTELMRHMARVDPDAKEVGLPDKRFVKAALRGRLPAATLTKRKQKFWLPFGEWFRSEWREALRDNLLRSHGTVTGLLGDDVVLGLVEEHERGEADHGRLLWALLFLETWCREHAASIAPAFEPAPVGTP